MKLRIGFAALGISVLAGGAVLAEAQSAHWPTDAKVFFVEPKDGAVISGPVKVVMGVKGIEIAPAGTETPHTGHHHILIDVDPPKGDNALAPLPADDSIKHFGKGQTETTLTLRQARIRCNFWSATATTFLTIRRSPRRRSQSPSSRLCGKAASAASRCSANVSSSLFATGDLQKGPPTVG